jgi:acetyl esterase/lipase
VSPHRSAWPRRGHLALVALAALGTLAVLTAAAGAAASPAGPAASPPSDVRPYGHLKPGRPLWIEPLPQELWLPGTAWAYRLLYTSSDHDEATTVVSGAVFVPEGKTPKHGWPVISWAHGTVGVADICAPSTNGRSQRDIDYLTAWLDAGYAIVATDYEGLGTPGPHQYLDGESAAYNAIDIVRAARRVDKRLSKRWMAVGQSQGAHAAMFAASLAGDYGRELDYRGAIATGMPSQWRTTAAAAGVFVPEAPANALVIDIIAGRHAEHPDVVDPATMLTPAGAELYERALTDECFPERAAAVTGLTSADLYAIDAAEQEMLLQLLDLEEIPIAAYTEPVYIAQGTADRVVYPPASATTAEMLAAAGTDVTFRFYPGADHNATLQAALPDLLAFAAARFS